MKDEWQECIPGGGVGRWYNLGATLHHRGEIRITKSTYERLGSPAFATVLYNPARQIIGVKPMNAEIRDIYRFEPRGNHGGMRLRVPALIHEFGLEIPKTLRFTHPTIDQDGILILDLTQTRQAFRVSRIGGSHFPVART